MKHEIFCIECGQCVGIGHSNDEPTEVSCPNPDRCSNPELDEL